MLDHDGCWCTRYLYKIIVYIKTHKTRVAYYDGIIHYIVRIILRKINSLKVTNHTIFRSHTVAVVGIIVYSIEYQNTTTTVCPIQVLIQCTLNISIRGVMRYTCVCNF